MDLHLQDMVLQEIIVVTIQEFMVIKVVEKIISIILREMLRKSIVGRLGAMMLIIQLQLQIIIII